MIEFKNVTAGYGKNVVVQDVSASVRDRNITCIIGPNGSGKTTLVKSIFGLSDVFSGDIFADGVKITGSEPFELVRSGLAYVPQVENVFPGLTVRENLEMGCLNRDRLNSLLDRILNLFPALADRLSFKAGKLSGGERQMLAVGRALMGEPSVLFLDEPTASLSPKVAEVMYEKLREMVGNNVTICLVDQNVKKALEISKFAYVMVAGRKVYEGSARELKGMEDLVKVFLGRRESL